MEALSPLQVRISVLFWEEGEQAPRPQPFGAERLGLNMIHGPQCMALQLAHRPGVPVGRGE